MCLRPVSIVNQSRHLTSAMPFMMNVPCGCCSECQTRKSGEYLLRNYFECTSTFEHGGYVLMDTLTYSDKYLPHLKDFIDYIPDSLNYPCFSYRDFRLFMVRLRRYLSNKGFDVKRKLRYFMASEYGTSEGCTHRPHYHILFYVLDEFLSPSDLSLAISKCWSYGRTDGLPYKTLLYVQSNVFDKSKGVARCERCINYVTKYVAKQSFYNKLVFDRVSSIAEYFGYVNGSRSYELLMTDIKKYSCQFHRQSEGFGLSALSSPRNSLMNVMRTGMLEVPSRHGVVRRIPLPQYFARKLFYDVTKAVDGTLHWYLNDIGIDYRLKRLDFAVDVLSDRFTSLYANLSIFKPDDFEEIKSSIDRLLDGRSWLDFTRYMLCYRGRVMPPTKVDLHDYRAFYQSQFLPYWDNVYYNYSTKKLSLKNGGKYVCLYDADSTSLDSPSYSNTISNMVSLHHTLFPSYSFERFMRHMPFCFSVRDFARFCIFDTALPEFHDFDALYSLLCDVLYSHNELRQSAFDIAQRLRDLYKQFKF